VTRRRSYPTIQGAARLGEFTEARCHRRCQTLTLYITPIYHVYLDELRPGLKKLVGGKKTDQVQEWEMEAVGG
jgi:hypothetical protein